MTVHTRWLARYAFGAAFGAALGAFALPGQPAQGQQPARPRDVPPASGA